MTTTRVNIDTTTGLPAQQRVLTVEDLAAQLQAMIEKGLGHLPVFTSDQRACYPFATMVPYTQSGYAECLLIQPQPHLHLKTVETARHSAQYYEDLNAAADRIRATCGAFA